jgi:hypothetical protein
VIKSVAYFPLQTAQNSKPALAAILASLQRNGITVVQDSMDADAVIIWSVLWAGRMSKNKSVYEHYRAQGKPVIVVDIGALHRGDTWKVAVNNINADGYYGHTENLDWDRPRKLKISLSMNFSSNPSILIAAQHRNSLQVANISSIEDWVLKQIKKLRTVTDRPIVVRSHPRCQLNWSTIGTHATVDRPAKIQESYDSFDMHFDYHAVVNLNSGPGIQSAIAGTRPLVDSTSLAYPVGIQLNQLEDPYLADRDKWLVEICHTEYTVNELSEGIWLERLKTAL